VPDAESDAITLSVPQAVFASTANDGPRRPLGHDWIRELTNQLLGRIKKRLSQLQVNLQAGLPSLATLDMLQRLQASNKAPSVYQFRTLRGDVIVVVDAVIDYSAMSYAGALELPNEGDIILF